MRRYTKRAMVLTAVRLPQDDRQRWWAAAKMLGVSQSQLFRDALREYAGRVLAEAAGRAVER